MSFFGRWLVIVGCLILFVFVIFIISLAWVASEADTEKDRDQAEFLREYHKKKQAKEKGCKRNDRSGKTET